MRKPRNGLRPVTITKNDEQLQGYLHSLKLENNGAIVAFESETGEFSVISINYNSKLTFDDVAKSENLQTRSGSIEIK